MAARRRRAATASGAETRAALRPRCEVMDDGSLADRGAARAGPIEPALDPNVGTSVCTFCHTDDMEPRRAAWREHNLRHVTQDHPERGITKEDVEDVLADAERQEEADLAHGTTVARGRNRDGVVFLVAFHELSDGAAFPVHARRGRVKR